MTHPFFARGALPRIFAHRGLITAQGKSSGVWENSAAAFAAAHAAGVTYIETDCQVTADGDPVLFHDEDLRRLIGDPRPVVEVRTRDLASMFADHGGLMTVADALHGFPDSRLNIDVKTRAAAGPLGPVLVGHTERVLLSSFSDANRRAALAATRAAGAADRPATSAGRTTIVAMLALSHLRLSAARTLRGIDALQIPERQGPFPVLTRSLLRESHRHGVEVHVWTVNSADDMRRLIGLGVDGIVTDRADLAVETLKA